MKEEAASAKEEVALDRAIRRLSVNCYIIAIYSFKGKNGVSEE